MANTSLAVYLPLANGNYWTFATGGKLADMGSATLTCTCPANGYTMERIGMYSPGSQSVSASMFFTKNTPSGATQLTNLVGVENDPNTNNIVIASYASFPYGIPIMDDSPKANESWNDGAGDQSTITTVGGTMTLPSGAVVNSIATDELSGNFNPITWSFAKGVGFTSIGVGSSTTTLTTFYVNTTTSQSIMTAAPRFIGSPGRPDLSVLKTLFK